MEAWGDFDNDGEEGRPAWKRPAFLIAAAAIVVTLIAVGYVVLNKNDNTPSTPSALDSSTSAAASATTTTVPGSTARSTTVSTSGDTAGTPSTSNPATLTTGSSTTAPATSTTESPSTATPQVASTSTQAPAATDTAAPTSVGGAAPPNAPSYSTLPDGSPAPVIAVFGTDSNTLTGAVPTQAAKDKLQGLMIAYSKTPVPVNNLLTIDPTVPMGVGVRVVELTSARFQPNSAVVEGFHALELDRVVSVMSALPNVTALVIGHADQIGTDAQNYEISAERAAAVVNYLVSKGVDPQRLSSRAVGDTDLLTLNDDQASLALNRRTEFVLYGLLGP